MAPQAGLFSQDGLTRSMHPSSGRCSDQVARMDGRGHVGVIRKKGWEKEMEKEKERERIREGGRGRERMKGYGGVGEGEA